MKKLVHYSALLLIITFIIVGTAAILIHLWITEAPDPVVNTAENALADESIVAIGHINHAKLIEITQSSGKDNLDSLISQDSNLLREMYLEHPDFRKNLSQILVSISLSSDNPKGILSSMFYGHFEWSTLEPIFSNFFSVTSIGNQQYQLVATTQETLNDPLTCPEDIKTLKKSSPLYLYVDNYWLVLSTSQSHLNKLLTRMMNKENAQKDLSAWREYRDGKIGALGVFTPGEASKSLPGMTGFIAQGAIKKNPEIESIFAGAEINILSPGLKISSSILGEKQWIETSYKKINRSLNDAKSSTKDFSQTLANLIDTIEVSSTEKKLDLSFDLGQSTLEKIPDITSELLSSAFGGRPSSNQTQQEKAERIEENPWDYSGNDQLLNIDNLAPKEELISSAFSQGPFSVSLSEAQYNEELELTTIELRARMELPEVDSSWYKSKATLSFSVSSILDELDNEILRDERCIKDLPRFVGKNRAPADNVAFNQGFALITKKLRLSEGKSYEDIHKISGKLNFEAPVDVKSYTIPFKVNETAGNEHTHIKVLATQPSVASYKVIGDDKHLIEVRALNANGQVLQSSFRMGNNNRQNTTFEGKIDRLQVWVASRFIAKTVDFTLPSKNLLNSEKATSYYTISQPTNTELNINDALFSNTDFSQLSEKDIKRHIYQYEKTVAKTERPSSVHVMLFHDYKSQWGNKPELKMIYPLIEDISFSPSVVSVTVNSPQYAKIYLKNRPSFRINSDRSIGPIRPYFEINNKEFVLETVRLPMELEAGEKISNLEGEVVFNVPDSLSIEQLAIPALGKSITKHDVKIVFKKITNGFVSSYIFEVSGEKFFNLIAITKEGRHYPTQVLFKEGRWELGFPLNPRLNKLQLITFEGSKKKTFPFTLKPEYR
ncbi:hypothetical protein [Pleionea sediminis]|uniref:hypothetical protein n=1 Tax=Pleionea sediminis TaxID=2569479 RepID=UPI0011853F6B|nr:hypothetical protein [Pleionea sediminis]